MKPDASTNEDVLRTQDIKKGLLAAPSTKFAFLACIACGVLLAGVFGFLPYWEKPTVLPEALSSELTARDGQLYWSDQHQPFTGWMLEMHREGGSMKSRCMIHAGRLHGLSEGWYANGQIQVRETFHNGVSHGLRTKWFEDGTKSSAGQIVEGKHDGAFRRWHENGMLAEWIEMKAGQPHGVSRAWAADGRLIALVHMEQGQVVRRESLELEEARQANNGTPLVQQ